MYLLIAIETLLIFPVLFFDRFISPSTSVALASSASVAATALHKCCSFGMHFPLYNCLDVLVEEVQILLVVIGESVVPGGEVILQVHFPCPFVSGKRRKGSDLQRPQM